MAKNCPLGKNVVQIGSKLPEMHNTSRELHDVLVDIELYYLKVDYKFILGRDDEKNYTWRTLSSKCQTTESK